MGDEHGTKTSIILLQLAQGFVNNSNNTILISYVNITL
jgi:hypothetical protein